MQREPLNHLRKRKRKSLKGNSLLNKLQDADDDDPVAIKKHKSKSKKDLKSEFTSSGLKTIPAEYRQMDIEGLILPSKVGRPFHERIGQDQFFAIDKLFLPELKEKSKAVTFEQHVKNFISKEKEPTKKAEIFQLLYHFGFFYVQVYLEKSSSFLEYSHFLTGYGSKLNLQGLIKVDSEIRQLFLDHPDWNWRMSRFEVQNILLEISNSAAYLIQGNTATVGASAPRQNRFTPVVVKVTEAMVKQEEEDHRSMLITLALPHLAVLNGTKGHVALVLIVTGSMCT